MTVSRPGLRISRATPRGFPKPRPLNALQDDQFSAISRVIIKGDTPEMIYDPIIHDDEFSHLSSTGLTGVRDIMSRCEDISDRLYRRYGVRNILLEGLSKNFVEQYNRIPLQRRTITGDTGGGANMLVHRAWARLLAEKAWHLLPASDRPLVGPLTILGREYDARIVAALEQAKQNGWFRNREVFEKNQATLQEQVDTLAAEYNQKTPRHPRRGPRPETGIRHHRQKKLSSVDSSESQTGTARQFPAR